ncbi:MAG TPA: hypothetical protein VHP14_00910 [Anaerolineales bacterium]|nr:hypothetical protein [Anaerolineales bacterium]
MTQMVITPVSPSSIRDPQVISADNASQLVLKLMNMGTAYSSVHSQDGKWLYISSNTGVYAYDLASHKDIHLLSPIPFVTAISPNEKFVATREAVFFAEDSQKLDLKLFPGGNQPFAMVSEQTTFSPDGSLIARYYASVGTAVWRLADSTLINTFKGRDILFSGDNSRVVVMQSIQAVPGEPSRDHVQLYNLQTGEQLGDWVAMQPAFLSDNSLVVEDGTYTRILDPETHQVRHNFEGISSAFSPDEQLVATLLNDHIRIYRVSDGKILHSLAAGSSLDRAELRFSPDGQVLAGYTHDAQCCSGYIDYSFLWRVADGTLIKWLKPCPNFIFSLDSKTVRACGQLLRTSDGSSIPEPDLPTMFIGTVSNLAFTPDGQQIVVACHQNLYLYPITNETIWLAQKADPETYQPILQAASPDDYYGLPNDIGPADGQTNVPSPDGELSARRLNGIVTIWKASGEGGAFYIPTTGVTRLAFSPDSQLLALGLKNGSVEIWSLADRQMVYTVPARTNANGNFVGGLAFSPDGKLLAIGLQDGTVRLFGIDVR